MSARDLLVEIGTEELPPKSLLALSQAFGDGIVAGLGAAAIRHGRVQLYAAPRRLAVLVRRVAERQRLVRTEPFAQNHVAHVDRGGESGVFGQFFQRGVGIVEDDRWI